MFVAGLFMIRRINIIITIRKSYWFIITLDGGSQRSYASKRVQNILSPEIINKEKIKINTLTTIILMRKSVTM